MAKANGFTARCQPEFHDETHQKSLDPACPGDQGTARPFVDEVWRKINQTQTEGNATQETQSSLLVLFACGLRKTVNLSPRM